MYCTLDDIKKLLPEESLIQLTDDEGQGTVDQGRVDEAIAQADAEIDSYCAVKYRVPFDPVPDLVKKCSVDLAIYNLYSRRVEEIPQTRTDRYRNAIRQLEGISKGTVSLGVDPAPSAASHGERPDISGPARIFSRTRMEDL
ncbi:MAG: DUF1320 domain-containing protein [Deltaproteobacteria bacterium]|nr:DUF1320 domain-containing protein [Deltaproteobacteria bacterium]MCL4873120.1 DUF1320 family protein [bacterium]